MADWALKPAHSWLSVKTSPRLTERYNQPKVDRALKPAHGWQRYNLPHCGWLGVKTDPLAQSVPSHYQWICRFHLGRWFLCCKTIIITDGSLALTHPHTHVSKHFPSLRFIKSHKRAVTINRRQMRSMNSSRQYNQQQQQKLQTLKGN